MVRKKRTKPHRSVWASNIATLCLNRFRKEVTPGAGVVVFDGTSREMTGTKNGTKV